MKHIKTMNKAKKRSLICALAMLIMLICQFLPYWSYGEGMTLSVQSYIWFPDYHQDLTKTLEPLVDQFPCNHAVTASLPLMVLCAVSIFICLRKVGSRCTGIFSIITGVCGLIAYLLEPVMRAGAGFWLHIAVLVLIVLCGVWMLRAPREEA